MGVCLALEWLSSYSRRPAGVFCTEAAPFSRCFPLLLCKLLFQIFQLNWHCVPSPAWAAADPLQRLLYCSHGALRLSNSCSSTNLSGYLPACLSWTWCFLYKNNGAAFLLQVGIYKWRKRPGGSHCMKHLLKKKGQIFFTLLVCK